MTKNLHSLDSVNFLQSINYTYNERGWLLQSTAPLFEEQLKYGIGVLGSVPQFNGNIDFASWGTGAYPDSASFIYNYDQLSRLTSGVSSDGNYAESNISYDKGGNILTMSRTFNGDFADSLSYNYLTNRNYSNQLRQVTNNAYNGGSYGLGNAGTFGYGYDGNGNMTADSNKNISIGYNVLNLPENLASYNASNLSSIIQVSNNIYDAEGIKLENITTTDSNNSNAFTY